MLRKKKKELDLEQRVETLEFVLKQVVEKLDKMEKDKKKPEYFG